ncbi:MAG TPA: DUF3302 domain-containing protein [Candidatus Methylomirabilis sp.]|nr:DUF3302 domain-containing protein [Candidatus Methylomirabilis sp.]
MATLLLTPVPAWAMSGSLVDTVANVLALMVLVLVPIAGIYLFWMVHILPEKVAEKRHHPQKDAIKTLCLLSLLFGGMLWPIAWLWAYSKPVMYKLAYGTDKHEDYEEPESADKPAAAEELARMRADLDRLKAAGVGAKELRGVEEELAKLENRLAGRDVKEAD